MTPKEIVVVSGSLDVKVGTDPAANTEISETVPEGKAWELLGVRVALVQGLTQTPAPALTIDDGTNVFYASPGSTTAQSASTTVTYHWGRGLVVSGLVGTTPNIRAVAPLPEGLVLPAGYRIKTVTAGIGANSNYGAPVLYVVEVEA